MRMNEVGIALAISIPFVLLTLAILIWFFAKSAKINSKIDDLVRGAKEFSPNQFFKLRNSSFSRRGRSSYAEEKGLAGVYVLYNKTKNMTYVGQAHQMFNRVNSHLTGKGNGDVYADYKYGDLFTIKMIPLEGSGFASLNDLERYTIAKCNAFTKGYNRTRGNRRYRPPRHLNFTVIGKTAIRQTI